MIKKIQQKLLVISLLVFGAINIVQAAPKSETWYFGTKSGLSKYYHFIYRGNNYVPNDAPFEKSRITSGFLIGQQTTNPHVGVEMSGEWLGRLNYTGKDIVAALWEGYGFQMSTILRHPISKTLDLYTRLGATIWHVTSDQVVKDQITLHNTLWGPSPVLSVGFEYAWTENIAMRLDFQWTNRVGNRKTVGCRPHIAFINFGFIYRFQQKDQLKPSSMNNVYNLLDHVKKIITLNNKS
ncbi:outer membrane beta-barrel protein [Candidatus Tachikawaea gelatinosa]|uniref:Outer membrane protein A n=1 Tax=Candidatus Tachikawaea gelatinosa TaxID=1410383 RepID=A0A090AL64_9ENTR|nr:outer membrane beta-barrel protein [Candidatus Tachikawaea gelatinosa]BAP58344.1 outer membrane protein A OmpA [Candidatus Tachikawaea gelatinosa]